jgi:hypothetical protein
VTGIDRYVDLIDLAGCSRRISPARPSMGKTALGSIAQNAALAASAPRRSR